MTPLPIADWQTSLEAMALTLAATLAALDRHEAKWAAALAVGEPPAGGRGGDPHIDRVEGRLRAWDERLIAAAELAAAVGKELADREAALGRWRETFTGWRETIQRGVPAAAAA